jgi:triosephosphate isomerase
MTDTMTACGSGRSGVPDVLYIGVSTKMYMGYRDCLDWMARIQQEVDSRPALAAGRVVPFVIPSFPVLPAAAGVLEGSPLLLGAQNCGWADGPWTGEVSPSLLAELGVRLVEIGHAERRAHLGEDTAMIALKVRAADNAGITPLLCVGEDTRDDLGGTAAERAAGFVYDQIAGAVGGDWSLASRLVIAYEPVWAIGAAEPAGPDHVTAVVRALRSLLSARSNEAGSDLAQVPIIYGGSAKPGLLPALDGVAGLFLGRFAHDARNFGTVLDEALALTALPAGSPTK